MIATGFNPEENPKPKAYASVGAGELTSLIWKRLREDGNASYEFNLFRVLPRSKRTTGALNQKHLRSLVRLAYVLTTVILEDGCLSPDEKSKLQDLANQLRPIVFPRNRF